MPCRGRIFGSAALRSKCTPDGRRWTDVWRPPVDDGTLYKEAADLWRYFATWREKLFAGYVTALGALAFACAKYASSGIRSAILVCGILVSIVFWILDLRNRELFSASQGVAARLENKVGGYRALDEIRFRGTNYLTHGFAIDLLVSSVMGGCIGALFVFVPRWYQDSSSSVLPVIFIVIGFVLLLTITRLIGKMEKGAEKKLRTVLDTLETRSFTSAQNSRPGSAITESLTGSIERSHK